MRQPHSLSPSPLTVLFAFAVCITVSDNHQTTPWIVTVRKRSNWVSCSGLKLVLIRGGRVWFITHQTASPTCELKVHRNLSTTLIWSLHVGRSVCYHVQFLGPLVERAWVHSNNMIPFRGKKKFDEFVQDKLNTCKDKTVNEAFVWVIPMLTGTSPVW